MRELASRKAVVTGGSSGIGKSIARIFSENGIETVIADIEAPDVESARYVCTDLTEPTEIDALYRRVKETAGYPDILVCNAGQGIHEKLTEGNPEAWERIFRLNVFSVFRLIRCFMPEMVQNGSGDVVIVSSVSARRAYPYGGIYSASKAAVEKLAETLRLEVQPEVRVTVIRPGVADTPFFARMISGNQTPGKIGWGALKPKLVADAVLQAINQPRDAALNEIVIRPAAQPL